MTARRARLTRQRLVNRRATRSFSTRGILAGRQQLGDCQRPSVTDARERVSEPRQ